MNRHAKLNARGNKQAVASLDPLWQIYIAELALQLVPLVS